jgi:hypothetical protein
VGGYRVPRRLRKANEKFGRDGRRIRSGGSVADLRHDDGNRGPSRSLAILQYILLAGLLI